VLQRRSAAVQERGEPIGRKVGGLFVYGH